MMGSSLVLLVVLQGLWLKNSYDKAYLDLRKQTNDVFRSTLVGLRDSLLFKDIEKIAIDSPGAMTRHPLFFTQKMDCLSVVKKRSREPARLSSQVKVYISANGTEPDSLKAILKPLARRIHDRAFDSDGEFVIRFNSDSLALDSLVGDYRKALVDAGIDTDLDVRVERESLADRVERDDIFALKLGLPKVKSEDHGIIQSEWIPYDPMHRYAVTLTGFTPMLVREIAPQILFSLFVTLLTGTAFFVMYRSMRAQQKLMELKNDFISNITHELKTPVTTVSVALEALRNFKGLENPQTTREYLDIAQVELNRLTLLTDKILKTAIFENRGVSFEPEPVDLNKTIDQILHSMKLLFEKQKAKVTFQRDGSSFMIMGGSVHLTNVIYNLLDNALKYGGSEPQIAITLQEDQSRVIIKVADEGIGIPHEYTKKIFEKFFRVPTGDVHNIKGYGLGLSYVKSVVASHKGLIEVSSKPGAGSIFTISLPKAGEQWALS